MTGKKKEKKNQTPVDLNERLTALGIKQRRFLPKQIRNPFDGLDKLFASSIHLTEEPRKTNKPSP